MSGLPWTNIWLGIGAISTGILAIGVAQKFETLGKFYNKYKTFRDRNNDISPTEIYFDHTWPNGTPIRDFSNLQLRTAIYHSALEALRSIVQQKTSVSVDYKFFKNLDDEGRSRVDKITVCK